MRALAGFVIRLALYGLVLGIAARAAEALWVARGLDAVTSLQQPHDTALAVLGAAPIVLALVGFGALRLVATFAAALLVGAALTAPFALARLSGGG